MLLSFVQVVIIIIMIMIIMMTAVMNAMVTDDGDDALRKVLLKMMVILTIGMIKLPDQRRPALEGPLTQQAEDAGEDDGGGLVAQDDLGRPGRVAGVEGHLVVVRGV